MDFNFNMLLEIAKFNYRLKIFELDCIEIIQFNKKLNTLVL
jgi:hypothetical protein